VVEGKQCRDGIDARECWHLVTVALRLPFLSLSLLLSLSLSMTQISLGPIGFTDAALANGKFFEGRGK
jgi:hypothetical protein